MAKTRLFRKGAYLAVMAPDQGFWICWTKTDVFLEDEDLSIVWLEKLKEEDKFERMEVRNKINLRSVITSIKMMRMKDMLSGKIVYRIPEKEKMKVEKILTKLKQGFTLNAYEKEDSSEKTSDVLLMEMEDNTPNRKRKHPNEIKETKQPNGRKSKKEIKAKTNKIKTKNRSKIKRNKKQKLMTKVDRTDPNRRLKPDFNIKVWTKDPLFEMKEYIPFVSSIAHSKLAIRAVLTGDLKLLEQCKENEKEITSLFVKRSLGNEMTAMRYAVKHQNLAAVKILCDPNQPKSRIGQPPCLLSTQGTGTYNYRYGNRELAAHFIEKDVKQGGSAFSKFYKEALLEKGDPWEGSVREVSAKKKAGYENKNITPLHCACINPSIGPLQALFRVCPDIYIADSDEKKLVHYAAACEDVGPLKFLYEKGANLEDPDKDGQTPLMIACKVGRSKCAEYIIEKLAERMEDEITVKKFGKGGVDKPGKDSWCPLHIAVAHQNHKVTEVLLNHGAKPNKLLSTTYDKISPLMLAAANGDLNMIKLLITKKAKIELHDRYKRTALTHAVINGSSNVASYLLSLGADPNKLDSSQNSNLHYACAYGWWFCMKVLIDAGAILDAKNEWSLTPLGVAIMKANKGLVDHLVKLPGIDINRKDEKGRTILLNMLIDHRDWNNEFLEDIQKLVERCGADPLVKDHYGQHALHMIANKALQNHNVDERNLQIEMIQSVAEYFIGKGLSTLDFDDDGNLPIVYAFRNHHSSLEYRYHKTGNVKMIQLLLHSMQSSWNHLDKNVVVKMVHQILSEFVSNVSLVNITKYVEIYTQIQEFIAILKNNSLLTKEKIEKQISKEQGTSITIFAKFCMHYSTQEISSEFRRTLAYCWEEFAKLLEMFINDFNPDMDISYINDSLQQKSFSALMTFSKVSQDEYKAFKVILKYAKNVDVFDSEEQTPLMIMIDKNLIEFVKMLIDAGADVNRIRFVKGDKKELPIERAMENRNMEILKLLISRGAKVDTQPLTGKSLLHSTTKTCAKNKTKNNLEFVKLLLESGCDVNEKSNESGITPLHIAVNNSKDDPDVSLDLEILLIRHGAKVHALDNLFRTPLHYAFVKKENPENTSSCDPIQIVSSLVECMTLKAVQEKDIHGASPLHYAALRGATVCSLLLIEKGSELNSLDNKGNSPLANAVFGKHDSCALMLIQKEANINVLIHNPDKKNFTEEISKSELWKYLPEHFPTSLPVIQPISLFEGIVKNDWLGITYVVLGKLEKFGMSFAKSVEVALRLQKLQFAKTLINRQVDDSKLKDLVTNGRNLMNSLAFESKSNTRNIELLQDVFELLDAAGVEAFNVDAYGCSSLHYAALNNDDECVRLFLTKQDGKKNINKRDDRGRTPLAAYFWNYRYILDSDLDHIPKILVKYEADPNVLFISKPLSLLDEGYNPRFLNSEYNDPIITESDVSVSPLIVAIVHRDLKMIQFLLENGAMINSADSLGRTPAMYAMKTNDQTIIDEILNHQPDLNTFDAFNHQIIDHTLVLDPSDKESPTYDNAETLTKILSANIDITSIRKKANKSPIQVAKHIAANESGKVLSTYLGKKFELNYNYPVNVQKENLESIHDHVIDSKRMMKNKENELNKDKDTNYQDECQEGCIVEDGEIYEDYDILMHKVDVAFGALGLYNFYRIQIWKETHKELYVLFTNWGRIDRWSRGQYQNTPFSTPDEAIREFCKIFKAKSGNEWNDREKFVNKQKKYRLVKAEHKSVIVRPTFEIDLFTSQKSQLHFSTQCFLRDITDVQMLKTAYKAEAKIDTSSVPFERIKEESILEAKVILEEISPLVEQRQELDSQKYKVEGEAQEKVLQDLNELLDKVCKLSSEYYFLVPREGYEYEKVSPIDNEGLLEDEKTRLNYLLEFETSKSIILGSMLRKDEVHPLDYIYSSLRCNIELMDENCQESQYIMKYMYRSSGATNRRRVEGIFRIQRDDETHRLNPKSKPKNRKLLWHGTKIENMISILSKGMVLNAPYAQITGRSLGDGIYFADIFDKSFNYSSGQFMLLCDVDLGDCYVVDDTEYDDAHPVDESQYDSLLVQGQNIPDEKMTLKTCMGYSMPLGKIIRKPNRDTRSWRRQNYSEYVVFNPENIVIRYIVKIGDGEKQYTMKDLFMKEQPMEVDAFKSLNESTGK